MDPANRSALDTDGTLIGMASKGDLDAFNQLVLRYQDLAYHYALSLLGDAASAEQVTQESLIQGYWKMRRFRGSSFRAWLLRIVTDSAYKLRRQSKHHPIRSLLPEDDEGKALESAACLVDLSAAAEATVAHNEAADRISHLLDELPEVHRSLLTLVDIYDLDYCEVAEVLNVPQGTVRSRLAHARQEMNRKIQADSRLPFNINRTMSHIPADGSSWFWLCWSAAPVFRVPKSRLWT